MAKFETSGLDKMMATLQDVDVLDEATIKEMMDAAGEILVAEIKKRVAQSGFATEDYVKSIKATKIKRNKYGEPYIQVTSVGKNKHGVRRAAVLFVLIYAVSERASTKTLPGPYLTKIRRTSAMP